MISLTRQQLDRIIEHAGPPEPKMLEGGAQRLLWAIEKAEARGRELLPTLDPTLVSAVVYEVVRAAWPELKLAAMLEVSGS